MEIKVALTILLLLGLLINNIVLEPQLKAEMALKQFEGGGYNYVALDTYTAFSSYLPFIVYLCIVLLFIKNIIKFIIKL